MKSDGRRLSFKRCSWRVVVVLPLIYQPSRICDYKKRFDGAQLLFSTRADVYSLPLLFYHLDPIHSVSHSLTTYVEHSLCRY